MNFTILIELLLLFAFTYFLGLPLSLSYIVERIIVNRLRRLRNGIAMALELTQFVGGVRAAKSRRPKLQEPNLATLEKSHYER